MLQVDESSNDFPQHELYFSDLRGTIQQNAHRTTYIPGSLLAVFPV